MWLVSGMGAAREEEVAVAAAMEAVWVWVLEAADVARAWEESDYSAGLAWMWMALAIGSRRPRQGPRTRAPLAAVA
jgi:hypothetical protein